MFTVLKKNRVKFKLLFISLMLVIASYYIYINCSYEKNNLYEKGFEFNMMGKNTNVYQFGGEGNDWCFVRTPDGYDPNRKKPYPFVICNHGNGWEMDGSIEKANWTNITMYLPLDDPDYIENPELYYGTNDSSLWYSNPTIEALLKEGYIVCGCQNYGDNLYGNNNCRNACVEFYYHMVTNYNVSEKCNMIGANNGAQTSINACNILKDKVKAMVLQYPLTNLVNQYYDNIEHQNMIKQAYEINDEIYDKDELCKRLGNHDVNNMNVENFPSVLLLYSTTDTVVNYKVNALCFYKLLKDNNKLVEAIQIDENGEVKEHGDIAHFNPKKCVEWFNNH